MSAKKCLSKSPKQEGDSAMRIGGGGGGGVGEGERVVDFRQSRST